MRTAIGRTLAALRRTQPQSAAIGRTLAALRRTRRQSAALLRTSLTSSSACSLTRPEAISGHQEAITRQSRALTSSSACSLTRPEPGTTNASLMFGCTLRPLATDATARMSSMRPLVHEPMNTLSTGTSASGFLTWFVNPMYLQAESDGSHQRGHQRVIRGSSEGHQRVIIRGSSEGHQKAIIRGSSEGHQRVIRGSS